MARGGKRAGAGRKPANYVPSPARIDLEAEVARNERAKADLNELKFATRAAEYVPREEVREACATMLAVLAQGLHPVHVALARHPGVSPEAAGEVRKAIDAALAEVADAFWAIHQLADAEGAAP